MENKEKQVLRVSFFQLHPPDAFLLAYDADTPAARLEAALLQEKGREFIVKIVPSAQFITYGANLNRFQTVLRDWLSDKLAPFTHSDSGKRVHALLTDEWTPWRLRRPFTDHEPSTQVLNSACREIVNMAMDAPQDMDSWFWKPLLQEQIKLLEERTVTRHGDPNTVSVERLALMGSSSDLDFRVWRCVELGIQTTERDPTDWWEYWQDDMGIWTKHEVNALIVDLKEVIAGTSNRISAVSGKLVKLWYGESNADFLAAGFQSSFQSSYETHSQRQKSDSLSAFARLLLNDIPREVFAWAAEFKYGVGKSIILTREPDFLEQIVRLIPPPPPVELETEGRIKILNRDGRVLRVLE